MSRAGGSSATFLVRISILVLGSALTTVSAADTGTIETVAAFTSSFVEPRRVDIWFPEDYSESGQALPVIYAQDGQNLFRSETAAYGGNEWGLDETIEKLVAEGKTRPAIVVGIWNTSKRFLEYGPEIPFRSLSDSSKQALIDNYGGVPLSENYLRFIVEELKPHIDETYNTLKGQADTYIMGSSMGGLISIYAVARYPDVFGGAACLSTHWPVSIEENRHEVADEIIGFLDSALPDAGQHKIYFDFGTETLDAWYEVHQVKMDRVMERHGYTREADWVTMKFEGEPHNEIAWKKRLHIPVEFLLGN